jgi:SAM-dependent methyltransferase
MQSYWSSLARAYAMLGPPLRPSREDVRHMECTVAAWARSCYRTRIDALLLGVTPDIANMPWPDNTRLTALDSALPMVKAVWPASIPQKRWAACGSWQELPLATGSCDVVLGDGAINCVRYPVGCRSVLAEAARVLRDGGVVILRCYVQPAIHERPEDVVTSIFERPDPSFHHFKFRLLMAMQSSTEQGIAVDDVYRFWADQRLIAEDVEAHTGWDQASIGTIDMYRDSNTVHTFLNRAELEAQLTEFFEVISLAAPHQETCPIYVLKVRRAKQPGGRNHGVSG